MSQREIELALKKQRLQMRSTVLRTSFANDAQAWTPLFNVADRGYAAVRWVRRHPVLPVAGLVALLVTRPRGVLRWGRRGLFAWTSFGKLRSILTKRIDER